MAKLNLGTGRPVPIRTIFFLLVCFTIGCKKGFNDYYGDKSPKGGFLFEKIRDDPHFSIFSKALERAGLVQYISQGGLYTVFAPTDEAFLAFLNRNGYASVDDLPVDRLFSILSFHIVNNMWYHYDLKVRFATYQQKLYLTRNKKFVNIDVTSADSIKINGVAVIHSLRDIDAANGVIHGIGEVLLPLPNLEEVLRNDPALANSTFYRLMQLTADSAYDRFNSYDRDRDGRMDSVFFKTYPLLSNVYTSIEFRQNTAPANQGGDPLFTTLLIPTNQVLDAFIAPALARIDNSVPDKIAALSPSYAEAVLEAYFIGDTIVTANELINRTRVLRSVNSEIIPVTPDNIFIQKNIVASNGTIQLINTVFPASPALRSALGQAMLDPELSSFMAAIQAAGLMGNLATTTRTGTYLAPTNAAFQEIGLDVKKRTLNGALLTSTQFNNIVRHHIINENLAPAGLTGTKNSDLGNTQTLVFSNNGTRVISAGGVIADILQPEISKGPGNPPVGYVYKVNKVLLPLQ
ncbi:fasciclin domain-containing protein [Longitalea arenae]|uniref:fasciclin domain-containing protein n=1 Tax=Longitalea arenae TaxID=2812558 RepID=UPI0019688B70|nr:fasciclin domain-containing protein [Longitalea arenae]